MNKHLVVLFLVALLSVSIAAAAKPFSLPSNAKKVAPGVYKLGKAVDNWKVVEGYAIVHYKEKFGKPGITCGNGICDAGENAKKCPADCSGSEPDTSSCYGVLARGAKWKSVEPYVVNPSNARGLDEIFVADNFAVDVAKWESAASVDILGDGSVTYDVLSADEVGTDGLNEVYFGSIDEPGAIAITIVWGIFGGSPKARELVEWDQIYDEADFDWSASGEAGKMRASLY